MSTPNQPEAKPPITRADGGKLRDHASELQFTPEQWAYVSQHLFTEGWGFARMRNEFAKAFGRKLSIGVWSRIFHQEQDRRVQMQARLLRIREASLNAQNVRAEIRASGAQLGEAALELIEQKVFELSLEPQTNYEALNALAKTILQARGQTLDREKFEEAKRKAAQAEETEKVIDLPLTPEERERRIKEIYGRA